VEEHAVRNRKFPSVQDFIRELVRRDMEAWDKEELERKTAAVAAAANAKK
jgi:Arc/MetJ-type ribon-helix-helix transcriptional regulator